MGRTLQKSGLLTAAAQQMVKAIAAPGAVTIAAPEAAVTAAREAVTTVAPEAVIITITTIITTTVHGAEASSGSRLTRTKPFELNFLNQK